MSFCLPRLPLPVRQLSHCTRPRSLSLSASSPTALGLAAIVIACLCGSARPSALLIRLGRRLGPPLLRPCGLRSFRRRRGLFQSVSAYLALSTPLASIFCLFQPPTVVDTLGRNCPRVPAAYSTCSVPSSRLTAVVCGSGRVMAAGAPKGEPQVAVFPTDTAHAGFFWPWSSASCFDPFAAPLSFPLRYAQPSYAFALFFLDVLERGADDDVTVRSFTCRSHMA